MISYLAGKVVQKHEKHLVLLVGGVGYLVKAGTNVLSDVAIEQEVELHIHTHVREDDLSLYGFLNVEELQFFEQLLTVSGIGPKVALAVMTMPVDQVKMAIVNEDIGFLSKVPGLGKKTAERLVLELKNKVQVMSIDVSTRSTRSVDNDAVEALCGLGYDRNLVVRFLSGVPSEVRGTEEVVRYFLQNA